MQEPTDNRLRVAVLFGGRSTEHEISIITALQVLDAFDVSKINAFPVYIDTDGMWFIGDELRKREFYIPSASDKKKLTQVYLTSDATSELIAAHTEKGWFGEKKAQRFPVDVFFPAFHGAYGEDGCIQGLLEWKNAAYIGSSHLSSAVAMNKFLCKQVLSNIGIPVLPDVLLKRSNYFPDATDKAAQKILDRLNLPVMIKPCNLGSSIGVSTALDEEQLMVSLAGAFVFDHEIIAEPFLQDMYELNISVLSGNPPQISAFERPKSEQKVLTFEQKYMKGNKTKMPGNEGMASMQRDINPEKIPEHIVKDIRSFALSSFKYLNFEGLVRFDFIVDKREETVFFNEVNPIPGSFAYYLWEKAKPALPFTELLQQLTDRAVAVRDEKRQLRRTLERRLFKE